MSTREPLSSGGSSLRIAVIVSAAVLRRNARWPDSIRRVRPQCEQIAAPPLPCPRICSVPLADRTHYRAGLVIAATVWVASEPDGGCLTRDAKVQDLQLAVVQEGKCSRASNPMDHTFVVCCADRERSARRSRQSYEPGVPRAPVEHAASPPRVAPYRVGSPSCMPKSKIDRMLGCERAATDLVTLRIARAGRHPAQTPVGST